MLAQLLLGPEFPNTYSESISSIFKSGGSPAIFLSGLGLFITEGISVSLGAKNVSSVILVISLKPSPSSILLDFLTPNNPWASVHFSSKSSGTSGLRGIGRDCPSPGVLFELVITQKGAVYCHCSTHWEIYEGNIDSTTCKEPVDVFTGQDRARAVVDTVIKKPTRSRQNRRVVLLPESTQYFVPIFIIT
ncbi:hypothetical protein PNOK_0422600 [Pyrrhoderma noxium]|uniref:Uncharacterized protein n=1 Tax=Pyrrhoderma noxium TaxID=2282107 RepID=A0A286UI61_9AGAM|nr:hypothetical protein PNOK_0422600 [Pyrrhoderma noxium]